MGRNMLRDEIREILQNCKTVAEWRAAAILIADMAYELDDKLFDLEGMISEVYGQQTLEDMLGAIAAMKKPTPEEKIENDMELLDEYGYTKGDMYSITLEQAIERVNYNQPVHILMPDNTEHLATSIEEVKNHNGYFGMTEKEMDDMVNDMVSIIESRE